VRASGRDITRGLSHPKWKGDRWDGEQFRKALRSIASSTHGALPVRQLISELGSGSEEALESMHLLQRRHFNEDARDVDPAAFGRRREEVYTFTSTAHLLAARAEMEAEGERARKK
jgi:hypothetical protein